MSYDAAIAALQDYMHDKTLDDTGTTIWSQQEEWAGLDKAVSILESLQPVQWKSISSIAGCTLHGIPILNDEGEETGESGRWVEVTCREYQAAMVGAGGYDALTVFGSMTNEDYVYTEWGLKDRVTPICAVGGPVNENRDCVGQTHAILLPERGKNDQQS